MLNQPSNISPDEVNGSGTVDLSAPVEIQWQVSGDSPLVAYKIEFFQNDAASTALGSTGKVMLSAPVWGVNYKGETQFYAVTLPASFFANAGMVNGNEYKFLITQWWGSGVDDAVTQSTASIFAGRSTPTLVIDPIPTPLTVRSYSITASYAQAQGDAIQTVRWQIATQDGQDAPFLDTGRIWGTGELQVDYDGFLPDTVYSVNCTVETAMGVSVSTGWTNFSVAYPVGQAQGAAEACQIAGMCAVLVRWDQMEAANGYSIYRRESTENVLRKIADVDGTTGRLRDYSAQSGHSYTYYVFPSGPLSYLTEPITSNTLDVQYWLWSILETQETEGGSYELVAAHVFAMGQGGVQEGSIRNNNNPQLLKNFTRYPTRQPETSNYLSGSVSGYIGTIDWTGEGYEDSVKQSDALFQLSTSQNTLFLLDPKGHFLRIHTSEPIELRVNTRSPRLPQTMTVGWTEVAATDGISIIALVSGEYYLTDQVISTTLTIDPTTGSLLWTVPDDYSSEEGSILSLEEGVETIYTDFVTRSGYGVTVRDGAEGSPVASLVGVIAGAELPSGKLTAWQGLRISVGGKNLLPGDSASTPDLNYIPSGTGTAPVQYDSGNGGFYTTGTRRRNIDLPAGSYTYSAALKKRGSGSGIQVMKNDGILLGTLNTGSTAAYNRAMAAFTLNTGDQLYLMVGPGVTFKEQQIEIGAGMSDYEAYDATVTELAFEDEQGQAAAVYGGTVDLIAGTLQSTLDEDGNALSEPITASLGAAQDVVLEEDNLFWFDGESITTQVRYATGSVQVVSAGKLIQTADGNFTPADMDLNPATGIVTATVESVTA